MVRIVVKEDVDFFGCFFILFCISDAGYLVAQKGSRLSIAAVSVSRISCYSKR